MNIYIVPLETGLDFHSHEEISGQGAAPFDTLEQAKAVLNIVDDGHPMAVVEVLGDMKVDFDYRILAITYGEVWFYPDPEKNPVTHVY